MHAHEALRAVAVEGHERPGERGEDRQLALVAGRARRQLAAQRERPLERPRGAGVVVQALGGVGGVRVPPDRLVGGARGLVVRGDQAARGVEVRVLRALQGVRRAQVVMAALGRAQRLVRGLADAAVAEVVGVEPLGAHDAAPPELVEAADEGLFADVARVGQNGGREVAADRRRDPGELAGRDGQAGEPGRDHRLHLAAGELAAGLDGLHEEQRIALRVREQPLRLGLVEGRPGHPLRQQAGLGAAQPPQLDLRQPVERREPRHQLGDGMLGVDLLPPRGGRDQERRRALRPQQIVQELEGRVVEPLKVVGDQQQRRAGGECLGERGEQPPALLGLGQRLRPSQLGEQPRELAHVRTVEPAAAAGRAPPSAATPRPARTRLRPRRDRRGPRR